MRLFLILFYTSTTIITTTWTSSEPELRLVVNPPGFLYGTGPPILIRKVDDFLNLTCRLVNEHDETLPDYNITWNWQSSTSSNVNRVMVVSLSHNAANLVFASLKETDTGEYTCKCAELDLSENVRVKVKPFKKFCSDKMFVCPTGQCIQKHYVCDGKTDCKDGMDEVNCGLSPCEGKIPCDDGRCIPASWCCDEMHDPNCTAKYRPKCCQQFLSRYQDQDQIYSEQHFSDMGFLQTTIYTVIGCAMAFMFIVTILVIAICRVHIKRTIVTRCPRSHQCGRPGSPWRPTTLPLYDIDMFLDRQTDTTPGGLLVTYNINNGVQFVGRPVDPPPYCEVIDTPPREGPPPPYVSRENIASSEPSGSPGPSGDKPASPPVEEVTSSPSVSGLNTSAGGDVPKRGGYDSDSESDSLESDALLETTDGKDPKVEEVKVTRSSSLSANMSSSPPSFLNNITAVSKTLIGSLKRHPDKARQLITQKSFDSSEPCDVKASDPGAYKITHSVGDLSPTVNNDFDRIDYLTLPLRESFIGVRNEEV